MPTIRTSNNPRMLIWAREEVGYSVEEASHALGISVTNLIAAEKGERSLTLNQLRKAAEIYACPYGYFYLSNPPHKKQFKPIPDFRIDPNYIGKNHFRLHLEIKKVRDRRAVFINIAESLDIELRKFERVQSKNINKTANLIRDRLRVNASEISNLAIDNVYAYWKSKIESDGVLVYESQYIPNETGVIGLALYYDICPVILIKRGDIYNSRKLFTLLHEYAHLLVGESGLHDDKSQTSDSDDELEVYCNKLASEILVPSNLVNKNDYDALNLNEKMEHMANAFKVTYTTAAVCLRRIRLITELELNKLLDLRKEAYKKQKAKSNKDIKIPRENISRLDMGKPMFNVVLTAYSNGLLDVYDASNILNLRVNKIDKLLGGI